MSRNLLGPSLNTSKKLYRAFALRFDGTLNVQSACVVASLLGRVMREKGIVGPVPLEISEDETAVISQATYNRRTDTIDGFCGLKANPHRCSFQPGPSAASYDSIVSSFQTMVIAKNVRLIMLNPLHASLPRCPLAILPTCMKFDSAIVLSQWESIRNVFGEALVTVGPIIAHASDGDNRRRKIQVQKSMGGKYGIERDAFIFKGEVVGLEIYLMD